jgi:glycosyltransferase involved in cell wall biosynthesis
MNKVVCVFRKPLLGYSETFIADQGKHLPTYRAVFCGFNRVSAGIHLLDNAPVISLDAHSRFPELAKLRFRTGVGRGGSWFDEIKQHSPSIIHAHFLNDGMDAVKLGDVLNVPVVTTLHGHDITKREAGTSGRQSMMQFFKRVDRVIAVSEFIAENALSKGCPESKLIQHSIGIDLTRFSGHKQESSHPTLLFVGRLVEKKGCTYLLQAMEHLKPKYPDLELAIVGDGLLRAKLEREAAERNLNVHFVGQENTAQIQERLSKSWVFVGPSIVAENGDAEGLGMVFLEAQALQTPVVSFRSGGVDEAIEDGTTGLLCKEKDVVGLAESIDRLLADSALRRRMGEQGRARVEKRFDIRKQCATLEDIYEDVIRASIRGSRKIAGK